MRLHLCAPATPAAALPRQHAPTAVVVALSSEDGTVLAQDTGLVIKLELDQGGRTWLDPEKGPGLLGVALGCVAVDLDLGVAPESVRIDLGVVLGSRARSDPELIHPGRGIDPGVALGLDTGMDPSVHPGADPARKSGPRVGAGLLYS